VETQTAQEYKENAFTTKDTKEHEVKTAVVASLNQPLSK